MAEDNAKNAITENMVLKEESVEISPEEWELQEDELPLVPSLKKFFSDSAWVIVENGLTDLKKKQQMGMLFFLYSGHCF